MIVWSCIAPHGGGIIPELAGPDLEQMAVTRESMEVLGSRCQAAAPETIVILTPHGLEYDGFITLSLSPRAVGKLEVMNGNDLQFEFDVDQEFAHTLSDQASNLGVPLAAGYYSENEEELAPIFPLDWGVTIPMWFMGTRWEQKPQIVVACPSTTLPSALLVGFGLAVARTAEALGRRTAIVASADQGHGHDANGPYGLAPASAEYDAAFCAAVHANRLGDLLDWDDEWVQSALADSYCQTVMLYGAQLYTPMKSALISYEAPTYFGMACAELAPR